jgi:hypothetical protein
VSEVEKKASKLEKNSWSQQKQLKNLY